MADAATEGQRATRELMTRKASRFAPSGAYEQQKRHVLERLQAYCRRFAGLGA